VTDAVRAPRRMRLTPELVARVPPYVPEGAPDAPAIVHPTPEEYAGYVAGIVADAPPTGDVWMFAYGSLIWNPVSDAVEQRVGRAAGWHRAFCLGWTEIVRASPDRPGLMLALDRGGECEGVVFRLPPDAIEANLGRLVRREMFRMPSPMVPCWLDVATEKGPLRAVAFVIDPASDLYVGGLDIGEVARSLAASAGERGTMAEYLLQTVSNLEALGVRDPHLWHLQELVAAELESAPA